MNNPVVSPLTAGSAQLCATLDPRHIEAKFRQELGMDVSAYFKDTNQVPVYQCIESELCFYWPLSLAGDGAFYAQLSAAYKGYYADWKWEYGQVVTYLKRDTTLLEIGCGNGHFLKKLPEKGIEGTGLELNPSAVAYGAAHGLEILNESLENHAALHPASYDTVCAFQVLEHVTNPRQFLTDALRCLKPGGLMAIGVPNNRAYFLKKDPYHTLNLPPHHTLLWSPASLRYVAVLFDLEVVAIIQEPASAVHRSLSYKIWLERLVGANALADLLHRLSRWAVKALPNSLNAFELGATVVAIYRKK